MSFQYSQKENSKRKNIRLLSVVAMTLQRGKNLRSHPMWSTNKRVHVASWVREVDGHRALYSTGLFKWDKFSGWPKIGYLYIIIRGQKHIFRF